MNEFKTLSKGLLESEKPSLLEVVQLPEVRRLKEVPQDPKHHPEGSAYIHTMEVLDRAAEIKNKTWLTNEGRLVYMFAALLHDVGKWNQTFYRGEKKNDLTHWTHPQPKNTRIVSYGHDTAGSIIVSNIFERIAPLEFKLAKQVKLLVEFHMRPLLLQNSKLKAFKKVQDSGVHMLLLGLLSFADKNKEPTYWWKRINELETH